ncbi:MAG TPA: hypothetical protein VL001_03810 [Candidimonas sp.]|nr:hypothetical protein [Candidimonas sp.]
MPTDYSPVERRIANALSKFPAVKKAVKGIYARLVFLINRQPSRMTASVHMDAVGDEGLSTFFGYYDKSPVSTDGYLLCHATRAQTHRKPAHGEIDIMVFGADDIKHPLLTLTSRTYNWQQGARAHWLDARRFIFNDFDQASKQYISRVIDMETGDEAARYARPVQDSFGRDYFLSINYRRIQALRPDYGYRNMAALTPDELSDLDNDGIWKVDQTSGQAVLLYSLAGVCGVDTDPQFGAAAHKVNHVMISPDGERFVFLHRYFVRNRKFDRLMLADKYGRKLNVLSAHGMVSHCFWIDSQSLLAYMRGPGGKDGYYRVDVDTGGISSLFEGALDGMGDGHPHVHGNWFITDTYPDKSRMQRLVKANLDTGDVMELGRFFQSFMFGGESRCDLHPRISPDGSKVFFDSVFDGRRRLYALTIPS